MREIGYGDTTVNQKMKFLVKTFYSVLLGCENYNTKTFKNKSMFLSKYLTYINDKNTTADLGLVTYFDKYQAFCFDLSPYSVLKDVLNFNYK